MRAIAILMCQGEQSRMANALGGPKQLVDIGGKPLLARTIDLLNVLTFDVVVVAPSTPEWMEFVYEGGFARTPRLYEQRPPGFTFVDALKNVRDLWEDADRVFVLNGDVLFSPEALLALLRGLSDRPLAFLTRFGLNVFTGRAQEEIYGFAFDKHGTATLDILLNESDPKISPYHAAENMWHMLHYFQDRCEGTLVAVPWDDYTDDVDTPEDVALLRKYVAPRLP